NGAIEDRFNLPDWFVATYAVSATGPSSGTAPASFTDGNVKISSQTGTFGYTTTMYPNSTNCTGTAQAPQTATATTTQQNLGAGGTGQSVLLEANLLNSANQSFVNRITPSG